MSSHGSALGRQALAPAAVASRCDVVVERRGDEHLHELASGQALEHADAVQPGHPQVHHQHVGRERLDGRHGRLAALDRGDQVQRRLRPDGAREAVAIERAVVGDDDRQRPAAP